MYICGRLQLQLNEKIKKILHEIKTQECRNKFFKQTKNCLTIAGGRKRKEQMKNDYNFMFLLTHIYRKIYTAFYS
jgi:hypothetical protein